MSTALRKKKEFSNFSWNVDDILTKHSTAEINITTRMSLMIVSTEERDIGSQHKNGAQNMIASDTERF